MSAGAKNGGGAWMTRAEAKSQSKRRRRLVEREMLAAELREHESDAGKRR